MPSYGTEEWLSYLVGFRGWVVKRVVRDEEGEQAGRFFVCLIGKGGRVERCLEVPLELSDYAKELWEVDELNRFLTRAYKEDP